MGMGRMVVAGVVTGSATPAALRLLLALLLAGPVLASEDQEPRPPGSDGWVRFDPSFFDMSAETGGDFYFWAPGELASADAMISMDRTALLLAYGELDGRTRELDVPVDGSVSRVRFQAGMAGPGTVKLVAPSGNEPVAGPGVRLARTAHMLLCTVEAPEAGTWRLEIQGEGRFAATATAKASLDAAIELAEAEGRPVRARVSLTSGFETASVRLIGLDGVEIAVAPARAAPGGAPGQLVADIPAPAAPFRIAVVGEDVTGLPYRRVDGPLRRGRTISIVSSEGASVTLHAGRPAKIALSVRNHASFPQQAAITAHDAAGHALPVEPSRVSLDAGASAVVQVSVDQPIAGSPGGKGSAPREEAGPPASGGTPGGTLVVVAAAGEDPASADVATVELIVAGAAPPR